MDTSHDYCCEYSLATESKGCCAFWKRTKTLLYTALCFIVVLVLLIIYLGIHYDLLHRSNTECDNTLYEKSVNETILRARLGDMKQKNDGLKQDVRKLNQKLEIEQEKLKNAQTKIALYVKTLKDLKFKYEAQIADLNATTIELRTSVNNLQQNLKKAEEKLNNENVHNTISVNTNMVGKSTGPQINKNHIMVLIFSTMLLIF